MFGLSSCTTSIVFLVVLALVVGFLFLIVGMGSHRIAKQTGKSSVATAPFHLYRPMHFGKEMEVPRSRLAGLFNLAVLLSMVLVLAAFARGAATC